MKNTRMDSVLTAEELKYVEKKLYEAPVRELVSRQIASLKTDIPEWIEIYEYKELTRRGKAKIWTYAGKDIPLVDEDVTSKTKRIYSIVLGYRIYLRELQASRANGIPLDSTRAVTTRRGISEKENELFFKGDAEYNIEGLLNYTGIQSIDAATVSGQTVWENKTGEEIVEDIRTLRSLVNNELGMFGDTLMLPPDKITLLDKPVYKEQPTLTIRKFLTENAWFSRILEVPDFSATLSGLGYACAMVADTSEDVMQIILPKDITPFEPVKESPFYYNVAVEERYGGVLVRLPKGIARMTKI